ncbi:SusC/RagA family TonB-linked outer membrane protein [Sphingobacterium daejeonense]|uniref:SusC/RagA family TonB-linked outer membrane protein n=1 Tax=Sphingobacterium daejeonense TaxID=371142 RepID=UPI0021A848C0|nr:SusC/RagA family TonB-linked outer membrane protein [Sphingobacterium daejeonense]MCT1530943.1 SusC/RagA family TonB-linked outer membrane protein [Sphingobacterium daejeonense]
MGLKEVLNELSKDQPISFSLEKKTILIEPKILNTSSPKIKIQQENMVGVVTDLYDNPLVGVTFKNNKTGKVLGASIKGGAFSIKVEEGDEILVTMMGFEPFRFQVGKQRKIKIELFFSSSAIEETVVTGYGVRKKETFTGASTTITRQELEKFNSSNIFSIIQSLDPAFKVQESNQHGSDPNRIPEITIRGTTSVGQYGINAPLVIMDGFEVPITRLYDLDINRIESITLLKDASSTVLYGSRGGNGVIVIETRLPKADGIAVTYNVRPEYVLVDLTDYNLMNSEEKLEFERLSGLYKSPIEPDLDFVHYSQANLDNIYAQRLLEIRSGVNSYWLSQPVQSKMSTNHSLRVEGGFGNMRFSLEGNYGVMSGIMKGSERRRFGSGLNLFYRIPNKITVRNTTNLIGSKGSNTNYGFFSEYTRINPYFRIHDEKGQIIERYVKGLNISDNPEFVTNPLFNASLPYRNFDNSINISNNLDIEYFIVPEVRFQLRGSIGKSVIHSENYISPRNTLFMRETNIRDKGLYTLGNGDIFNYEGAGILTFAKLFHEKHSILGNGIFELSHTRSTSGGVRLSGFADDRFISPSLAFNYDANSKYSYRNVPERRIGFMGNASYSYDDRLYADFSFRKDGSSKYGRNKRYGDFWSSGFGYNLHNEKYLEGAKFIDLLRVYYNTGVSGADNLEANITNTYYKVDFNSLYNEQAGFRYESEGNPDLRWPSIRSHSIGFLSSFFKNRFGLRLEAYRRITSNMTSNITVAPSVGIVNNSYTENLGKVQNEGYELQLDVKPYESPDQSFNVILRLQGAYNRSKLLEISEELKNLNHSNYRERPEGYMIEGSELIPQSVYYEEGQSLSNLRGVKSLGIDPATGREMLLTLDNKVTYVWDPMDMRVIGNQEPRLFGNIAAFINYRNMSLEAYFNYTLGGQVYNQTLVDKIENIDPWYNADRRVLYERWKMPGDHVKYKAISDQTRTQLTSRFVQNENYIRLGSLNFNYLMGHKLTSKLGLQRLRFNFSMNDVFRISTVRMERGTDYPFSRTFNFGILAQY